MRYSGPSFSVVHPPWALLERTYSWSTRLCCVRETLLGWMTTLVVLVSVGCSIFILLLINNSTVYRWLQSLMIILIMMKLCPSKIALLRVTICHLWNKYCWIRIRSFICTFSSDFEDLLGAHGVGVEVNNPRSSQLTFIHHILYGLCASNSGYAEDIMIGSASAVSDTRRFRSPGGDELPISRGGIKNPEWHSAANGRLNHKCGLMRFLLRS
jgi:hypothetical protein